MMGRLVDGLITLASSISALIEIIIITRDNIFSSMIEGQAVAKVERKTLSGSLSVGMQKRMKY
jgi:hypothetical protein